MGQVALKRPTLYNILLQFSYSVYVYRLDKRLICFVNTTKQIKFKNNAKPKERSELYAAARHWTTSLLYPVAAGSPARLYPSRPQDEDNSL